MIPGYLQFGAFRGRLVHLGVSGSVAAYKALDLSRDLLRSGLHVSATLTGGAQQFVTPLAFQSLGCEPVYSKLFHGGDDVYSHLQPAQNAEALAVVPATANILAKIAHGLADDILSCQALAFPRSLVLAPAMNPAMWEARATQDNVAQLRSRGDIILEPDSGEVACGESGKGRLSEVFEIYLALLKQLSRQDLNGSRVLITLGPTREFFDPVRFWSNPSSGRMGAALAVAAWLRGAEVHCVSGPIGLTLPRGLKQYAVISTKEMHQACMELWPSCDIGCLCAAVADFRPESFQPEKLKKDGLTEGRFTLQFAPNPDILKELGGMKRNGQRLAGFAAETGSELEPAARSKLQAKNLDVIVANRITIPDSGFESDRNEVLIVNRDGNQEILPAQGKGDIAWRVWDWILKT